MDQRINWKQLLLGGLLTGVVSLVVGVALYVYQNSGEKLVYSITESSPFESGRETMGIFSLKISNSGSKVLKNIRAVIEVDGKIKGSKIKADPTIKIENKQSDTDFRLDVVNLNPGEQVTIGLLTVAQNGTFGRPRISLRADGILGREESETLESATTSKLPITSAVIATYTSLLMLLLARKRVFPKIMASSRHSDDQRPILAFLYDMHGLVEETERIMRYQHNVTFWSEADRLGATAFRTKDKAEAVCRTLESLCEYTIMATTSEAIVNYNLAKTCIALGNTSQARTFLEKAKSFDKKLIETRMSIDPAFKELS